MTVDQLDAYEREYQEIDQDIIARAGSRELPMPSLWRTERQTGLTLYTLVRAIQPEIVVETGHRQRLVVGDLPACPRRRTARAQLHSFDVRDDVGKLVDPDERDRWTLHILKPARCRSSTQTLAGLPPIGLFFHDSDHSYLHMRLELRMAGKRLAADGALCSDDVSLSHAYIEACEEFGLKPRLLVDQHKASGFAVR